jgi:CO/xanthine dehydrogenase FAD-binding subunit
MKSNAAHDTARYALPRDLEEAIRLMESGAERVIAGGTDVYPGVNTNTPTGSFVDITRLDELRGISGTDDHHRIGALTTWSEIASSRELPSSFSGLRRAAREVGSVQIQNVATIGGNLANASPAADGVPPLLVLDASVELASWRGTRVLPLSEFIVGYRSTALERDELLTAVLVPRALDDASTDFRKLGSRAYLVISIVMVATLLQADQDGRVTSAAVAVGACSPVAMRLSDLEEELVGRHMGDDLQAIPRSEHLAALSPIDDVRASGRYRRDAALTLVRRSIGECRARR